MKVLIATPCAGGIVRHEYMLSVLIQSFLAPDRLANIAKYDLSLYAAGGYSGRAEGIHSSA